MSLATSSQIVDTSDLSKQASFKAAQTRDMCSQQPGIFSMQHFCMKVFIKWFSGTKWVKRHLAMRPKKIFPLTFSSAIDRKS